MATKTEAQKAEEARVRRAIEREKESDEVKGLRRIIREEMEELIDEKFAGPDEGDDDDGKAKSSGGGGFLEGLLGPKSK
jgi:hypothetical protein